MQWGNPIMTDDKVITMPPVMLRNGYKVVYQDITVQLSAAQKKVLEEKRKKKGGKRRLRSNPNFRSTGRARRPEAALVIRTEDEMKELEAKKHAEEAIAE